MSLADESAESSLAGVADADPTTMFDLPKRQVNVDELPAPVAEGDLRDTFDLPLMSARDAERAGAVQAPGAGDAAALFDDRAGPKRRTTAAEARSQARRCCNCGGVVPQGMSICVSCGVDQETGLRIGLEDDLAPPPAAPAQGPPLHVSITGGLLGVGGLILLIVALIKSVGGSVGWEGYGWICLALVSGFGIYASVQFIRGRSLKQLMLALTLGVIVDALALIALPLGQTFLQDPERIVKPIKSDDPNSADSEITPYQERLDARKIKLGIVLIAVYCGLSVYLMSPPVKRYFHSRPEKSPW
jgi:hypothetical protein